MTLNKFLINNFKLFLSSNPDIDDNISVVEDYGIVLDFTPTMEDLQELYANFPRLNFATLFKFSDAVPENIAENILNQILHYVGLDTNLNDIDINGVKIPLTVIKKTNKEELQKILVDDILYQNKPFDDSSELVDVVKQLGLEYDLDKILNNEMRICLYNEDKQFSNGDDAIRYVIYTITQSPLLIKSRDVLKQLDIQDGYFDLSPEPIHKFVDKHSYVLSQVFNRHKNIFMALKQNYITIRPIINKISKMSKNNHVPIFEAYNKIFASKFYKTGFYDGDKLSTNDLFKGLNVLQNRSDYNFYQIRNGKIFYKKKEEIITSKLEQKILETLKDRLKHLVGKNILLDEFVDYGLPISKKQTWGNLPIDTEIMIGKDSSVGIHWRNDYGVRDLDLSCLVGGTRIGWGSVNGYINNNVKFSGDVTNAPNGAMEFLTTKETFSEPITFVVNNFSEEEEFSFDLVVGNSSKSQWIDNIIVKECQGFSKKGNVIGFLKDGFFKIKKGSYSSNRTSSETDLVSQMTKIDNYTIQRLFNMIGINYHRTRQENIIYDYDLSYNSISYDKIEKLLK